MDIINYNSKRGNYSPLVMHNDAIYGFWLIGRWYTARKNGVYFYGAYPPSYLDRLSLIFPQEFAKGKILHLFSGSITGNGKKVYTLDINSEPMSGIRPNVVADAEEIDQHFSKNYFDLVLADPPYGENYKKYKTKKINRKKVINLTSKIIKNKGYLIWLDTIVPQWRKADGWNLKGLLGVCQSTNHSVRFATILQKLSETK